MPLLNTFIWNINFMRRCLYSFVMSFGCRTSGKQPHQSWPVVSLYHDKNRIYTSCQNGCNEKYHKFSKWYRHKKRKKAQDDHDLMSDLRDTHGLNHFFRCVELQRKAFRIIDRHIRFPAFDTDFLIKRFFEGFLPEPSGLIVDPAFYKLKGSVSDDQPHGEVITYRAACYGQG